MTNTQGLSLLQTIHYTVAICLLCLLACEGSHTSLGPETEKEDSRTSDDTDGARRTDSVDDGGDVEVSMAESCEEKTGVTVRGEIRFDGEIPSGARLWVWFEAPEGGIPPCSQEIETVEFPASFLFADVPSDSAWSLSAMLDVDGGHPPIPVLGDYVGRIDSDDLDLSAERSDVVISLSIKEK